MTALRKPLRVVIVAVPPVRALDIFGPAEVFGDAKISKPEIRTTTSRSSRQVPIASLRVTSARRYTPLRRTGITRGPSIRCSSPAASAHATCGTSAISSNGCACEARMHGASARSARVRSSWPKRACSTDVAPRRIGSGPAISHETIRASQSTPNRLTSRRQLLHVGRRHGGHRFVLGISRRRSGTTDRPCGRADDGRIFATPGWPGAI